MASSNFENENYGDSFVANFNIGAGISSASNVDFQAISTSNPQKNGGNTPPPTMTMFGEDANTFLDQLVILPTKKELHSISSMKGSEVQLTINASNEGLLGGSDDSFKDSNDSKEQTIEDDVFFSNPPVSAMVESKTSPTKDESKKADEIFQQQAEAARQMRERKPTKYEKIDANRALSKSRTKASHSKVSTNSRSTPKSNEVDDFLASMGDFDQDKIRNAKSKFANEVEADEYAKRRRRVEELEKAEASHESRNKKKKSDSYIKMYSLNYFCIFYLHISYLKWYVYIIRNY